MPQRSRILLISGCMDNSWRTFFREFRGHYGLNSSVTESLKSQPMKLDCPGTGNGSLMIETSMIRYFSNGMLRSLTLPQEILPLAIPYVFRFNLRYGIQGNGEV